MLDLIVYILRAVNIDAAVVWDVTPCGLVDTNILW